MTFIAHRFCTVIGERRSDKPSDAASAPLGDFASSGSYVLIGEPGAGKTTAFQTEADARGGLRVSVRDFLTDDDMPYREGVARGVRTSLPDAVIAEFHKMEEKESDANFAAYLLKDAWKDLFEAAVVVSNDNDLVAPIHMVNREWKWLVFVVCPDRWQIAPPLRQVASHVRHIRPDVLRTPQFADTLPSTTISKPRGW